MKTEVLVAGFILLFYSAGFYASPMLLARVASHWNAAGQVDGFMPRTWGVFLLPTVYAVIAVFFLLIPRIDPMRKNILEFIGYYNNFIIIFSLFMLGLYAQTLLWNIGYEIGMNTTLPVGLGILFYYAGVLCEHSKRNYFIGIRTPWTLASDVVWEKTHKIGGRLFKAAGIISLLGVFARDYAVFLIILPMIAAALYTGVYSYLEYRKGT